MQKKKENNKKGFLPTLLVFMIVLISIVALGSTFSYSLTFDDNYGLMRLLNNSKIDNTIIFPQENFVFMIPKTASVRDASLFDIDMEKIDLFCNEDDELIYSFDYEQDFVDWNENRLSAFRLDELNCNDFSFKMYFNDNGIDKVIKKDINFYNTDVFPDFMLENIDSISNDVLRAQIIYALSGFESFNYVRDTLLEDLKSSRNNDAKCWPRYDCSSYDTSKILYYLKQSGFSDSRVYKDAKSWLISKSSDERYSDYELVIDNYNNDVENCTIEYADFFREDTFNNKSERVYGIDLDYGDKLEINCSDDLDFYLYGFLDMDFVSEEDRKVALKSTDNDNFYYTLPSPCVRTNSSSCDIGASFYLSLLDIDESLREYLIKYFVDYIKKDTLDRFYFDSPGSYYDFTSTEADYLFTSMFYHLAKIYEDDVKRELGNDYEKVVEGMLNWLFYNQNNDGSWSSTDYSFSLTADIVDQLIRSDLSFNENLNDAKKFLISEKGDVSSVADYSNFYSMIKADLSPFVSFEPVFVTIKEKKELTITNPTPYIYENALVEITLDELLISSYDTKDRSFKASKILNLNYLASKESKKVNVVRNDVMNLNYDENENPGVFYGYVNVYLDVSNLQSEYFKNIDFDGAISERNVESTVYSFSNSITDLDRNYTKEYDFENYILATQIPVIYIKNPTFELNSEIKEDEFYDGNVKIDISASTNFDYNCRVSSRLFKNFDFELRVPKGNDSNVSSILDFENTFTAEFYGSYEQAHNLAYDIKCVPIKFNDFFEDKESSYSKNLIIYKNTPFELNFDGDLIDKDKIISVKNNVNQSQTIYFTFEKNDNDFFYFNKNSIILEPYATQEVVIKNNVPNRNYSIAKITASVFSDLYKKSYDFRTSINPDYYEYLLEKRQLDLIKEEKRKRNSRIAGYIIIFAIVGVILFFAGKFGWKMFKDIKNKKKGKDGSENGKDGAKEGKKDSKKSKEEKESEKELLEMVKIMRTMGKKDPIIKNEIQKQGVKPELINSVFKTLEELDKSKNKKKKEDE